MGLADTLIVVSENASITIAFILAIYFLWSYRWGERLLPYALITLSLGVQMVSGLLYARGIIASTYSASSVFNIGWLVAFALHDCAARVQRGACERIAGDIRSQEWQGWVEALLPAFLLLCIASTTASADMILSPVRPGTLVLAIFAAILALRESGSMRRGARCAWPSIALRVL